MQNGYFSIHRKIFESAIFQCSDLFKMAIYIIGNARIKPGFVSIRTGRGETIIKLEIGQLIFGQNEWSKVLKMKSKTTYNRLKKLEKLEFITTQNMTHYTLITVVNYNIYQNKNNNNDNKLLTNYEPITNQLLTNCEPVTTNNKDNKENKDDNVILEESSENIFEEIKNLFSEICVSLPRLKKISENTKNLILKRNEDLENNLENWKDFFIKVEASDFLTNRLTGKPFRATFDWLLNQNTFSNVINGNYDNLNNVYTLFEKNETKDPEEVFIFISGNNKESMAKGTLTGIRKFIDEEFQESEAIAILRNGSREVIAKKENYKG